MLVIQFISFLRLRKFSLSSLLRNVIQNVLSHSLVSALCDPMECKPNRLLWPWGLSRQEYRSGFPCPTPWDLPNPGIYITSYQIIFQHLLCFNIYCVSHFQFFSKLNYTFGVSKFNQYYILMGTKIIRFCCANIVYIGVVCAHSIAPSSMHTFLLLPCLICHLFYPHYLSSYTIAFKSIR